MIGRRIYKCDGCVSEEDSEVELPCFLVSVPEACPPNVCPESGSHRIACNWKRIIRYKELINIIKNKRG